MKKCYSICLTCSSFRRISLLILVWISTFVVAPAQTDPCSINPGSNFDVCFTDDEFKLNGLLGPNVIPASVNWSVTNTGFIIDEPGNAQTLVFPNPPNGDFPLGPVVFTITATCVDGQQLTATVEVTVDGVSSQATILANGLNVPALTVCSAVHLEAQTPPGSGELGTWYHFFADPDINFVAGGDNQNFWDISIDPNNKNPCRSYRFYYEISNGGCFTRDSVTITFEAQDENVRFTAPQDQARYCSDGNFYMQATAAGCLGIPNFSVISYPGATPPVINPNYAVANNSIGTYAYITESGWYTFVYSVDANGSTCASGADTVHVYICLSQNDLGNLYQQFCGIPEQLTLSSPCNPAYEYGDWYSDIPQNPLDPPTIVQTGPCTADVTIENTNVDRYRFRQRIRVNSCMVDSIEQFCYVFNTIDYFAAPQIEDTLVTFFCGGDPEFRPWSYFPSYPNANLSLKVIHSPDPVYPPGQTISGNVLMNLYVPGTYTFEMRVTRINCSDVATLTVIIDDLDMPEAGVVADFCLGELAPLTGSIPPNPAVQVLWRQIDNNLPLQFSPSAQVTNPYISAAETGHYVLEYSYSRTEDCYLADTLEFDVIDCDTGCLQVTYGKIRCFDNGTTDPSDDYWNFAVYIAQGPGLYWSMTGPPQTEYGPYGQTKVIWMDKIANYGSTVTVVISDFPDSTCFTTLEIPVPEPCSDTCNLQVDTRVGPCNNNGTPVLASDDFYYVTLTVSGTGGQCWMAKKKNADGTEELLGSFTGDQIVTLGPIDIQDGDWTLWVFICDQMDCIVDLYVQAPEFCSGCHRVEVSNITCYDNGTSDPSDDYWTFDLFVNGGPGTFWFTSGGVNDAGPYGQVKTIHMGQISQYGSQVYFTIHDNSTKACETELIVPVPRPCSAPCNLRAEVRVGDCVVRLGQTVYYVTLSVSGTNNGCWMAKQKFSNGTEVILGTYYGDQTITLGPFNPAAGDWTLWVFDCESMDCIRDFFIDAPSCLHRGDLRSANAGGAGFRLYPVPATDVLVVENRGQEHPDETAETIFIIYDMVGRFVSTTTLPATGAYRLDIASLAAGLYYLGVYDEKGVRVVEKFVKE